MADTPQLLKLLPPMAMASAFGVGAGPLQMSPLLMALNGQYQQMGPQPYTPQQAPYPGRSNGEPGEANPNNYNGAGNYIIPNTGGEMRRLEDDAPAGRLPMQRRGN